MKDYLTLNPSYSLRQDGNRVILRGKENEENHSQEWFSFIHPYYGMLLSFFSLNNMTFKDKIQKCSEYFKKDERYIMDILEPLIENSSNVTVKTRQGGIMSFPINLLILSDGPINRKIEYFTSDFQYKGLPDFQTNRVKYPVSINLELIMKCYTDCCYCYADRRNTQDELLTTDRIIELIREAALNGVFEFDINGGEVLLHPDIKIILRELKKYNFNPLVSTKIPIKDEMLVFFKEIGINRFQISLDSADEHILTSTLKTPRGYLAQIKRSLDRAAELGISVDINTVLTKYNTDILQIEKLLTFLSSFKCINHVRLNPVGYSLYRNNFTTIVSESTKIDLVESKIPDWINRFNLSMNLSSCECESQFYLIEKMKKFKERAICTGNVWNIVILANGDVTICEELYYNPKFIIGNIKDKSIKEVWNSKRAMDLYNFTISSNSGSTCKNCEEFKNCRMGKGVCWKTILMAYGDENWDFPDPMCPKAPFPYNQFYYR